MSDYAVNIEIPDYKLGDAWQGIQLIGPVVDETEETPDGTLTRLSCTFIHSSGRVVHFDSDSSVRRNGTIAIENAATWEASIPSQAFLPVAGHWSWDMKFYSSISTTRPLTCYDGVVTCHAGINQHLTV
jgi:hypothetical protein